MTHEAKTALRVLYIHPVGSFGGASRSLLEMLRAFPAGSVEPRVLCPRGNVVELFRQYGVPVIAARGISQFDNTLYGHYRGLRWLLLLRTFYYFLFTLSVLRKARECWPDVDVIHVNELTAIPAAMMAKKLFSRPIVMHVRSVQRPMDGSLRGRLLLYLLRRYVDRLVVIDATVRASLPATLDAETVHNGFPAATEHGAPKNCSHIADGQPVARARWRVGFVGLLLRLKGVYEFVEAAKICVGRGLDVEFVIVGDNARNLRGIRGHVLRWLGFAEDVRADLERYIRQNGLSKRVRMTGFMPDVKSVYDSLDVLCFPSHLNACGRPVFEAAFSRVPSIVAVSDPKDDTIIDGETGICIEARNPNALADAIEYFCTHPEEIKRMGEGAYRLAMLNFDISSNAARMLEVYRRLAPAP